MNQSIHGNQMILIGLRALLIIIVAYIAYESTEVKSYPRLKAASNSYLHYDLIKERHSQAQVGKENATLVMLARNSDLEGALKSMRSLEDRFNREYHYPWVFMNEVPFDEEFIEQTTLMASGETFYELIPIEDWEPPSFIEEEKLEQSLRDYEANNVIYGGVRSYRNMCHFNSGFFYKQKRLLNYDWYFRVEPDVEYMCDFQYDPFQLLREQNKEYGFIVTIHEYENTIPTLWQHVEGFMQKYPHLLHENNALDFITSQEPLSDIEIQINSSSRYNMCHFWSNFEIGSLNFFRSEAYETYFNYLDRTGGFYYERWGDAPIHSIAVSLLLDKNKIHHFEDIGYYHAPFLSCPLSKEIISSKRCICKSRDDFKDENSLIALDTSVHSCLPRWWKYGSGKRFLDTGKIGISHVKK